ncbi:hypothetical protein J21TS7_03220 [Paenibacillus cineris]|uniref:SMI1/KNR4 family protein n=2 Tax=Paenibacillus cineris TaxID=237530 RepID=A0ABQ4L5Y1_9BACL|nr:hypothetical protein J21TS7_03220 [Paenibacillus cineris]
MSLMRIKVPAGFAVCYNKFEDIEPVKSKEDQYLENWGYFTEDILQIYKMELRKGSWIIPEKNKCILDLGWYPDSDADGSYHLVLVNEDWEVIRSKESRNRFVIRDTLEEWMDLIQRGGLFD